MGKGFSPKSELRISDAVQYVERYYRSLRHRRRRWFGKIEDLKPFELGENWIPPKAPYKDNYSIQAEDSETGKTRTIWFPTFKNYGSGAEWLRIGPFFYGVGRKPWIQADGGYGGATQVWCTFRCDHWEIIGGCFAQHAWGKADAEILAGATGSMSIWWTTVTAGNWTITDSGRAVDVYNFGGDIAAGNKGLAMYHPAENHWTVYGT